SRRRHTRSKRDWSSDVCSSDLASSVAAVYYLRLRAIALALRGPPTVSLEFDIAGRHFLEAARCRACASRTAATVASNTESGSIRSEERRVGKEWKSRLYAAR